MKAELSLFLAFLGFLAPALAHEDPIGEIYPEVTAERDYFKVTFYDNTLSSSGTGLVGRTFSKEGAFLAEAPEKGTRSLFGRQYSFPQLVEEQSGIEVRFKDSWIIIPEYERKHAGTPYVILISGETVTYQALAWSSTGIDLVRDALVDGNSLYLLVTRSSPAGKVTLWLYKFSLTSLAEEASVQLDDPCTIYSFPRCSNLIGYDHRVYLAIAVDRPRGTRLVLASWNGVDAACKSAQVTSKVDWNTHISMANLGEEGRGRRERSRCSLREKLALAQGFTSLQPRAYHYPGAQEGWLARFFPRQAKIVTRHLKLNEEAMPGAAIDGCLWRLSLGWYGAGCAGGAVGRS